VFFWVHRDGLALHRPLVPRRAGPATGVTAVSTGDGAGRDGLETDLRKLAAAGLHPALLAAGAGLIMGSASADYSDRGRG